MRKAKNNSKTATKNIRTPRCTVFPLRRIGIQHFVSKFSLPYSLGRKIPPPSPREIKRHEVVFFPGNTIPRFNEPANKCALAKDCKKKNICGTYAPVCKGCADPAIIATLTARTLFLDLTIAVCWIKPLCLQWLQ